jgi:prepilin-type processing-associated H-X9-DG protein
MSRVENFLCPSDLDLLPESLGGRNNYYGNSGSNILFGAPSENESNPNHNMPACNGVLVPDRVIRFADLVDGTSMTACISEKLKGDGSNAIVSVRSDTLAPGAYPANAMEAYENCRGMLFPSAATPDTQGVSNVGAPWIYSYHSTTRYYHVLPPNMPSCMYPPGRIATTAGSHHPGGANVAMTDGSVRFVTETVNVVVWQSLGSRDGNEAIDGDAF